MRAKFIFIVFLLLSNFVFVSSLPRQTNDLKNIDKEMVEAIKTKKIEKVKELIAQEAKTHAVAVMAQEMLEEAQEKVKTNPTAENYVNLALIYEEKVKEYDLALQNYKKGISYADKNPWVFHHIGICYEQTGRMNKAIEYYQRSI